MEVSADVVPAPFVDPDALVLFLDALRRAGYRISTDQYIAAQDVVLALASQGAGAGDAGRLARMLGPLVCATPKEQAEFGDHFDRWVDRLLPARQRLGDGAGGAGIDAAAAAPARGLAQELDSIQQSYRWLRWVASPLVVVLAVVLIAAYVALRRNTGTLLVHSTPDRAAVRVVMPDSVGERDSTRARTIDSAAVAPLKLELKPGTYTLELSLPGHADTTVIVLVTPRSTRDLDVVLRPLGSGAVWFRTRPVGATVVLDTSTVGTTPSDATGGLRHERVSEGVHRVRLLHPGFKVTDTVATVEPNRTDSIDVVLRRARQVVLAITSIPPRASVVVDGQRVGTTPMPGLVVDEGQHEIRLSLAGYATSITSVNAARERLVLVQLAPLVPLRITSRPTAATVSVDGDSVAVTPALVHVPAGARTVAVERDDFEVYRTSLQLTAPDSLDVVLVPVRRPRQRIAFSDRGDTMVVGDPRGSLRTWNLARDSVIDVDVPPSLLRRVPQDTLYNSDSTRVALPNDETVIVRDPRDAAFADTLEVHAAHVSSVAFSPDRRFLASGDASGGIHVWAMTPQPAHVIDPYAERWLSRLSSMVGLGRAASRESLSIATGGEFMVTTSPATGIRLWNIASGNLVATLVAPNPAIRNDPVSISADGRRVMWVPDAENAAERDSTRAFWVDVWDGKRHRLRHADEVKLAAMRPDGRQIATLDARGVLRLWDKAGASDSMVPRILARDDAFTATRTSMRGLRFSPDGRRVLVLNSVGDVYVLRTDDSVPSSQVLGLDAAEALFTADGVRVVTNGPSDAHLWNVDREGVAERLIGSPSPTVHVDVSAVEPWAVGVSQDGKLRLWNLDSLDQAPRLLPPNDGPATSARFSPDGRSVLVRFANATRVQLLATDGVRRTMVLPHDAIIDTALWSANGQQIITTSRGIVRIWNANGITEVADLKGHAGEVRGLAFSPDSRRLASAGASGTIRLWDAQTFTLRDSLRLPDSLTRRDSLAARGAVARRASAAIQTELHDVAFAPDGASLAVVASTGAVGIYATPGSRWLTVWLAVRHAWPIALAVVFLPIPWLIYRLLLRRRATAFIRRQTNEQPQIEHIRLRTLDDGLFPERSVMRIASRLRRRIDMPSPELDVTASVTQTLRHGGVFTPAFRRLKVTPEYLALVDRATLRDQQTAFVDELLDRLRSDQVLITRYYFDGDPRVCFPADPSGHPVTLGTLTQQYESHRILLFADARRCFNPVTGEMARWTDLVRRWPVRALLTPEVPARWGSTEETVAREMAVYHASVAGLTDLADEARSATPNAEAEESAGRFPPALLRRPGRWIERVAVPPAEVQEMLAQVRAYLGDDGITWLAACAVYPAMSWKLTLNLGHELHASDGGSLLDADRLLRLSRLPWFRHGYIPDWLRLTLLDLLTSEQEAQVRRTLELLLLTAVAGDDDSFDLEVANRHKQTIHALAGPVMRRLRRKSPPSAPLRDYVFAEFMSGRHRERLAVKVARAVPVLGKARRAVAPSRRAVATSRRAAASRRRTSDVALAFAKNWSRIVVIVLAILASAASVVLPAVRAAEAAWQRIPPTPLAVGRTPRVLNPAATKPNSSPSPALATAATRDTSQRPVDEGPVRELGPTPDSGATPFRDRCDVPVEVRVRAGWWMNSIQLVCRAAPPQRSVARPRRGGDSGAENVFRLAEGERITAVSGSYDGEYGRFLFSLQLHTNRRSSPVYGNGGPSKGQTPFRFEIPASGRFVGLSGRSGEARSSDGNLGDYLVSVGVLYVGPPATLQAAGSDSSRTPRAPLPTASTPLRIVSIDPGDASANVSIDAGVRLLFPELASGDRVDLATVTPERVRVSGGGRVVPWRANVQAGTVVLVPTEPLVEFTTRYTVSVAPGIASVQGRQLTQPVTSTFTTVSLDSLYYYRITNAFLGPRHSLNANPTCAMQVASGGDAGDWFFTPIPQSDGYYFMHNAVRGTTGVLEGAAPPDPCFIMDFAGTVFGGIMWKPVPTSERSVFTLENANFKSPRSLTVSREDGRTTTMQPTSVDAAQLWRFSRARRR